MMHTLANLAAFGAGGALCAALLLYSERRRRGAGLLLCEECEEFEREPQPAATPSRRGQQTPAAASVPTPRTALVECMRPSPPAEKQRPRISAMPTVGHSRDPDAKTKRTDYISWDDYFLSIAILSSFRSKDPNRQVGACIVDPATQRIVGIGYNGFPIGCGDDQLPWARVGPCALDTKYPYVCHAEMNAIMNKNTASLEGMRIYVTLFPCNECAKLIIQSRLSEVGAEGGDGGGHQGTGKSLPALLRRLHTSRTSTTTPT